MWQILINGPGYYDTSYDLPEGTTTLGRADDNDIVLSGELVSRRHASLYVSDSMLKVEDLGSRNGVKLNGQPVVGKKEVHVGDSISVGENTLAVTLAPKGKRSATDSQRLAWDQGGDVRSAVILSKAVNESFVFRVLDNVVPPRSEPGPGDELTPVPAAPETPKVAYEALLLVSRIARLLATAGTLQSFLEQTVDLLMPPVNGTTAVILLQDPQGALEAKVVRHRGKLQQGEVPVSHSILQEALKDGEALAVSDVRGDERFQKSASLVLYGAGQVLCIPIGSSRPFAGALYLNRPVGEREGLEPILDLCTAVAHLIDHGIQKFTGDRPYQRRWRDALERSFSAPTVQRFALEVPGPLTRLEERVATVLFVDLAGINALSSPAKAPVAAGLLEQFYQRVAQVVHGLDGAVVTCLGDSVLVAFGTPYSQPEDGARAIQAALKLRAEWEAWIAQRPPEERCPIKIAIHRGKVLCGTIATAQRVELVAMGDAVNRAAWLAGLATPGQVLATGAALEGQDPSFVAESVGEHRVGLGERIALFELRGS